MYLYIYFLRERKSRNWGSRGRERENLKTEKPDSIMYIYRVPPRLVINKAIQRDTSKTTTDKSKWNSETYSSDPQKCKGKKPQRNKRKKIGWHTYTLT